MFRLIYGKFDIICFVRFITFRSIFAQIVGQNYLHVSCCVRSRLMSTRWFGIRSIKTLIVSVPVFYYVYYLGWNKSLLRKRSVRLKRLKSKWHTFPKVSKNLKVIQLSNTLGQNGCRQNGLAFTSVVGSVLRTYEKIYFTIRYNYRVISILSNGKQI